MTTVRLVHISDVHVMARSRWGLRDYLGKRLTSWINLRFRGRAKAFARTEAILSALRQHLRDQPPDAVVFSGDSSALGFREEIALAAEWLGVATLSGFAVPGNHDYLTPLAARSGAFERAFAPWLTGGRIDGQFYPFARKVGPLWLVGVNSCVGNLLPQDARGRVGVEQLARLERLLSELDAGPRVLVTHYPVCQRDGRPDKRFHELRDLADLVRVAEAGGVALWLHGHRHDPYHLVPPGCSFPVICAGSTTQSGVEGFCETAIDGENLTARSFRFDGPSGAFAEGDGFKLRLRHFGR